MRTIRNLSLILAVIAFNTIALNAQCIMNHNHSKPNDSLSHKAHFNNNVQTDNNNTYSFKVEGKCGMCKNRIEKAALAVKGINTAEWNEETKLLTVNLKPETNQDNVNKAIADAGHDTEKYKADDKVYNRLPMCCKYR